MSLYRNFIWFTKGMLDYTKSGYLSSSKWFNGSDLDVDCRGQSYMVTGATSHIGKAVALVLAKRGGTVHLVCEDRDKGQQVKEEIQDETNNTNLILHIIDLSEPRQVYKFATDFAESDNTLHVLINHADLLLKQRENNSEGIEKHFATNTLGVHILTTRLVPLLSKSVEPRVVTISSSEMLVQKLDLLNLQFENLVPFSPNVAYAQTKRQQVVMAERYAERHPGVHFSSVNPGWTESPRAEVSHFQSKMEAHLRTPAQGADTVLWLALSHAALRRPSGLFYLDRKPSSVHLPLAWTKTSLDDEIKFMNVLDDYYEKFRD